MLREVARPQNPERHVLFQLPRDPSRREHPRRIRIQQHLHHHPRCIGRVAPTVPRIRRVERRQIHTVHQVADVVRPSGPPATTPAGPPATAASDPVRRDGTSSTSGPFLLGSPTIVAPFLRRRLLVHDFGFHHLESSPQSFWLPSDVTSRERGQGTPVVRFSSGEFTRDLKTASDLYISICPTAEHTRRFFVLMETIRSSLVSPTVPPPHPDYDDSMETAWYDSMEAAWKRGSSMHRFLSLSVLLTLTLLAVAPVAQAQPGGSTGPWQTYDTSNGEWRSYAGDIGGKKYSPLDQIGASNFADLEIAWEWTSVDTLISRSTPGGGEWSAPLDTIVESLVEENPRALQTRSPAACITPTGHAAHGRWRPLFQHAPRAGGRGRRDNRRDTLGLQPEGL